MDSYVEYPMQSGYQHLPEERRDASQAQPHYMRQPATTTMSESHKSAFYTAPNLQSSMSCEIKPRLTKEQHDLLEKEYGKQHKPNTATKKGFAEQLGVSLDKVNNWFQNRRAKSKQDAKKAAGAMNLFNAQQQPHQVGYSSDSDVSPAFSAPDYFSMMQQCTADEQSNGLGIDMQQFQDPSYHQNAQFNPASTLEQYNNFQLSQRMGQDMFDSPQELNRRTLTQEQFDAAWAQQGGSLDGNMDFMQPGFGGQAADLQQYFPELQGAGEKQEPQFDFGVPPPMSSFDSTIPSLASDRSAQTFSSSPSIQDQTSVSATSSEWTDSRSSSVAGVNHDESFMPMKPTGTSSTQWQPGQSVPVDFNALNQEFQQAAEARRVHEPPHVHEQPLAWPADDAYARRDSQTSKMLAQGMSNVGIHTPQPQQQATFKSPAPPMSIAARRQRPRPAALGLNAMRSQSYSGILQPGSPGQAQPYALTPGQPALRRIRSTNVMNGIAQGRVQKSMPGSAQRSPLAFSFADAMNSPKAMRHASSQSTGNLAPPTPLSPNGFHEQVRQHSGMHASGHVSRQPSISETDIEHGLPYVPASSVPAQNFSSPPHTPMYHQQNFVQQRVGSNVITENTPPQSAPASQQCFAANTFSVPQPQMPPPPPQQMQTFMQHQPQPQQFMNVAVPEQHFQVPNMSMAQVQQMMMPTSSAPAEMPMQYSQVPVVNAQGQLMVVPQQFLQQVPPQVSTPQLQQPQQMHTPPQGGQYITFSSAPPPPPVQVAAQAPKQQPQQTELFVHEYSPPAELKRAATPRKAVDSGPKNYTFANSTSNDYQEKRRKADAKAASASNTNSPASSVGAASGSS